MAHILLNIDVDDMARAIAFYCAAFELKVGRRFDAGFVELLGAEAPFYLLQKPPGSAPFRAAEHGRSYARHWTPLHLDLVVPNLVEAIERAIAAGAKLEGPPSDHAYGRLALLSDPFGHGFCLLEFRGRGYDELPFTRG